MDDLYTRDLLRMAALAHGAGRLADAQGSASLTNPLCGDRVVIDVNLDEDGRIGRIGHQVRACVLCQAGASMLGQSVPGHRPADLRALTARLEAALSSGAFDFAAPWTELAIFEPAAALRSRHSCVLMPFRGLVQAISNIFETT